MKREDQKTNPEPQPEVMVQGQQTAEEFKMGVKHTCIGDFIAIMLLDVAQEILLKSLCGEGMANMPKRVSVAHDAPQEIRIIYVHGIKGGMVRIKETSFDSDLTALFAVQNGIAALQEKMEKSRESLIHLPGGPGPGMSH